MQDIVTVQAVPAVAPAATFTPLQLMGLFLGSSVLAAVLTALFNWHRERRAENADRRFAALYIAVALEDYAQACSEDIYDSDQEVEDTGDQGRFLMRSVPDYPQVQWKALGIDRTVAAMSFRVKVDRIRTEIIAASEYVDWDDLSKDAQIRAVELGRDAIKLARNFRKEMRLPPRDLSHVETHFSDLVQRHEEEERRAQERRVAREAAKQAAAAPHPHSPS